MTPGAGDRSGWLVAVMRYQRSVRRTCSCVWGGKLTGGFALAGQERAELGDRAHQGRREDDGRVLVDRNLDQGLEVAQLQGERVGHHHVRSDRELAGGERFALGGDDLGALLAL